MAVFHFMLGICKVTVNNQTFSPKSKRCVHKKNKKKTGGESEADRAKKLLSTSKRNLLPVLLTNALAIMKSGRPFTDFKCFIKLDKTKGVEVGNTYLNRKQRLEFGLAMAGLLRSNLAKNLKKLYFLTRFLMNVLICTI